MNSTNSDNNQNNSNDPLFPISVEKLKELLEDHLKLQSELCRELEDIADCLPDNVNSQACLQIARSICPIINCAHNFEEDVLFPYLLNRSGNNKNLDATIERLRFENWEDESYADEVRDGLRAFVAGEGTFTAESLGYMLRGFFSGLRRHISFERAYFLPIFLNYEDQY